MYKLGIGTGIWWPGRFLPLEHLPLVASAGFHAVELNLFKGREHFDDACPHELQDLKSACDKSGIEVWSIHTPDVGSLGSADANERERQFQSILSCVKVAEAIGASVVVSHGLLIAPFDDDLEGSEERLSESLQCLKERLADSSIRIAFENGTKDRPGHTGLDVLRRLRNADSDSFGFVLDSGHANIAGDLDDLCNLASDCLISLHLNDNDGRGDSHLLPGEGTVNWSRIANLLNESDYEGPILYEIESGGGTRAPEEMLARTMAGHDRQLAPFLKK